jgi:hypothetical protein
MASKANTTPWSAICLIKAGKESKNPETFADNSVYDEAMRLGRKYRNSLRGSSGFVVKG